MDPFGLLAYLGKYIASSANLYRALSLVSVIALHQVLFLVIRLLGIKSSYEPFLGFSYFLAW